MSMGWAIRVEYICLGRREACAAVQMWIVRDFDQPNLDIDTEVELYHLRALRAAADAAHAPSTKRHLIWAPWPAWQTPI